MRERDGPATTGYGRSLLGQALWRRGEEKQGDSNGGLGFPTGRCVRAMREGGRGVGQLPLFISTYCYKQGDSLHKPANLVFIYDYHSIVSQVVVASIYNLSLIKIEYSWISQLNFILYKLIVVIL